MLTIKEAVIVEGRYDKARLAGIVDTTVIDVGGFRIFKDAALLCMIKSLARKCGIIIFTDSDSAGFKIRSYLKSTVTEGTVKHAYIPDVYGKEKRKVRPSGEGKLGVEGIDNDIIEEVLRKAGSAGERSAFLSKADMYGDGLIGGQDSRVLKSTLAKNLGLPCNISSNNLLDYINTALTENEYKIILKDIKKG